MNEYYDYVIYYDYDYCSCIVSTDKTQRSG